MRYFLLAICIGLTFAATAQDDLLTELEKTQAEETDLVIQTFKGTRVVNGHSVETKPAGSLEFIIQHRFGPLNDGAHGLWGLDYAFIRFGLEYGITDRLGVAVGRSSVDKSFDSYVKYKLAEQTSGARSFPFTATLLGTMAYKTSKSGANANLSSNDRLAYAAQVLIARKFSPAFSFQVSPIFIHRNAVDQLTEVNDLFALGLGGRVKVTRSMHINLEYYPRLNENSNNPKFDAIGIGIDIETGGHVFQMVFTNSIGSMERIAFAETADDFFDGGIHFGFNITRTFQLTKKSRSRSADW